MEILFAFPFNTMWGLVILFLFNHKIPLSFFWTLAFALAGVSFFFGELYALQFWFPGDMGVVLFSALISVKLLFPAHEDEVAVMLTHPNRRRIRLSIEAIPDFRERRKKYFESILKMSNLWKEKDSQFTKFNTVSLISILVIVFVLPLCIISIDYFSENKIQEVISNSITLFVKDLPQEIKKQIYPEKIISSIFFFGPFLTFFVNSLSVLLMLGLMRRVIRSRRMPFIPLGDLALISLNDHMIWSILISATMLTFSLVAQLPSMYLFISLNLFLILAFIFALQGFGIIHLFMEIRLLPSNWIYLGLVILSIPFSMIVLPIILVLAFLIGVTDFWFLFRKKALHPIAKINNIL